MNLRRQDFFQEIPKIVEKLNNILELIEGFLKSYVF